MLCAVSVRAESHRLIVNLFISFRVLISSPFFRFLISFFISVIVFFEALQYTKAICIMSHCSVAVQLFPVKEARDYEHSCQIHLLYLGTHCFVCVSVIAYIRVCAGLTDFGPYAWLQWDVVTSNDVNELKGRLVCLRAKWEFSTSVLSAGTKHQHMPLSTRTT